MSKIKVLVLPSDRTGVGKFRSIDPHTFLQNLYPDDFHVDINYEPPMTDDNFWKGYQIIHFNRTFGGNYYQSQAFIQHLNSISHHIFLIMVGKLSLRSYQMRCRYLTKHSS